MSTDVAVRPEDQAVRGFELAEQVFTPERRGAIANFLNVGAEDPVLLPYLVTCATYGLSPIMGEIWLIPQSVKVRDGNATRTVQRYRPAVGRDGFLTIARRDPRYQGLQGAVVCERDTFEVEYTGDLDSDPRVLHRFASKPTVFEEGGEAPDRYRGKIIGAWAKAYAKGLPPMFYYANLREHGKLEQEWEWGDSPGEKRMVWLDANGRPTFDRNITGRPKLTWAGAWDYISPMILKAAQSYVLRILFGITGLAPADEIVMDRGQLPAGGGAVEPIPEFDWERLQTTPELHERLRKAVEAANELAPMSWSPAKIEMVLLGRSDQELEGHAEAIEREVELHASRIDPPPSAEQAPAEDEPVGQQEAAEPQEAEPEPAEAVVTLSEQDAERLRHERAELEAAMEELERGSEEYATRAGELFDVEARLRGAPTIDEQNAASAQRTSE